MLHAYTYVPLFFCILTQLISLENKYVSFLLVLCDFAVQQNHVQLRDTVRNLMKLLPTGWCPKHAGRVEVNPFLFKAVNPFLFVAVYVIVV